MKQSTQKRKSIVLCCFCLSLNRVCVCFLCCCRFTRPFVIWFECNSFPIECFVHLLFLFCSFSRCNSTKMVNLYCSIDELSLRICSSFASIKPHLLLCSLPKFKSFFVQIQWWFHSSAVKQTSDNQQTINQMVINSIEDYATKVYRKIRAEKWKESVCMSYNKLIDGTIKCSSEKNWTGFPVYSNSIQKPQ